MGDGEYDATPGRRRASGAGNNGQRITPHPRRALGAAPWERFSASSSWEPDAGAHLWQAEPPADRGVEPVGERAAELPIEDAVEPRPEPAPHTERTAAHANGAISVADLIAKVGAPLPDRPSRHVAPDTDSSDSSDSTDDEGSFSDDVADRDELLNTQVIDTPAYSLEFTSELPDLGTANYPNDDDDFEADCAPAQAPIAERPAKLKGIGRTAGEAPKAAADKPKSRRPMLLAGRSLAAVFAVLALIMTGSAWHWSNSKNGRLKAVSALDPHSSDIVDPDGQYGDENFLIVGMDSRAGENANIGAGDADDAGGARSDTVMLVNIPANRQRVVVVSFPRDLAITPMQCEAWNPENGKYGPIYDPKTGKTGPRMVYTETKLNSTFSFGGPKCLVKEIQKLSGLSINRFIAVDFVGFARMVEALGGVEVCSTTALKDYELGTVLDHAGRQVINGATALNYVRARQVTTESNGDYGRIKRQQLFVSSLLRTLISSNTLLNLNKLNNVVNIFISNSYVDNVRTRDLVQLGQSLQHIAAGHVTFVTVPTGVTDQNGDEPPRTADMKALFAAIISDEPLPLENDHNAQSLGRTPTTAPSTKKAPPPSATPEGRREQIMTTSPHEVTVQVSNSTAQAGLAAIASSQLRRNGFNVMTPDDYPSSLRTTTVFFSPGNEQAAATVASAFATSKVERVTGIGPVVQVVLGPDFSSVTAPPPSGSSVTVQIERNSSSPPTKLPVDLAVTNAADTTCE
ncbi:LytR family transcriptional regulator [Mycobacterium sp. 852002-51163_SCH5372311]|uniref:LCP family protein n=1 Tax=Mycobacterium sp. 852002-51163_SCH5372311 TaxID=1834097 RepID=UPI0008008901|nr:LCP family protein [Mycobacterium sp. 852002-51163_SCH5372311]OBF87846.1 LytR family transcriptional regulator [Mycobacterium sp. 852002-51163_SCH5372311]